MIELHPTSPGDVEPAREFDPVAYLRRRRRIELVAYRRRVVRSFLIGLALGIVLFSVAVEVFA